MEVHHHSHPGKKKFKEYLQEGFMIFVAVSMGFLAENVREMLQKHERERELIILLRDDLKSDIVKIDEAIKLNRLKQNSIDTLRQYIYRVPNENLPDSITRKMFYLYKSYTGNVTNYIPTSRAFSQLEKGDAFSLIRKQNISDSILSYKEFNNRIVSQYETFVMYQKNAHDIGHLIFDPSLNESFLTRDKFPLILESKQSFNLFVTDKKTCFSYAAFLVECRGILYRYLDMVSDHKQKALSLITLLEKTYELSE